MKLRDLIAAGVDAGHLPAIHPERCVWARLAEASCERCVDSCPQQAWRVDDDALTVDPARCDGCGLCAAACPEGALINALAPLRLMLGDTLIAVASCDRSAADLPDARLPCVHTLGLGHLAALYSHGVSRLVVCVGDCAQCPRGGAEGLGARVAQLNRTLDARGARGLTLESIDADQWHLLVAQAKTPAQPKMSRRAFLRGTQVTAEESGTPEPDAPDWRPPGQYLANSGDRPVALFAPQIDAHRCNGCDACLRICPHAVLGLSSTGDAIILATDNCTACGLCVDVCDQEAVEIAECVNADDLRLPLHPGRCRVCGAAFHHPSATVAAAQLCHVCARVPHRRNLYQVL